MIIVICYDGKIHQSKATVYGPFINRENARAFCALKLFGFDVVITQAIDPN